MSAAPAIGQQPPLRVTLLGTGTPTPSAERMGACLLVETPVHRLLFDAGRGCVIRLDQARVPWPQLSDVFLSHLHADHTFALPDIFVMGWTLGRTQPLQVRGPVGTQAMMTSMVKSVELDVASRALNGRQLPQHVVTEIQPGVVFDNQGLRVTAFEVDHVLKPSYGFRIDYGGHSAVYSGDTRLSATLIEQAKGVDLLIHEVVMAGSNPTPQQQFVLAAHTQPAEAARVFQEARPKLAVFTHVLLMAGATPQGVLDAARRSYSGRVEMGADLMTIDVSNAGIDVRPLNP